MTCPYFYRENREVFFMNFKINDKNYKSAPFDFNLMCRFEDFGVDMSQIESKPLVVFRAYFAICSNMTIEEAGNELNKHVCGGNDLSGIIKAFLSEMKKSDFFQKMTTEQKKIVETDAIEEAT